MSKYRVVIRGHYIRRDVGANLVTKKLLEKKGCNVFLSNSINHLRILKLWKPHVVVENVIGKIEKSYLASPQSKFVLLHSEGANPKSYIMSNGIDKFDKIFCWGSATYEVVRKISSGLRRDSGLIIGNPRLDLVRFGLNRDQKANSKSIGIVSSGISVLNRFDGRLPFKRMAQLIDEGNLNSFYNSVKVFQALYQVIKQLMEKTNYTISFRPHVSESLEGYKFLEKKFGKRFQIDNSLDIANWIKYQRALITTASSSFLEAYLLNVPAINIDKLYSLDEFLQNGKNARNAYETCLFAENLNEIIELIDNPPDVPKNENIERLLEDVHNYKKNDSVTLEIAEEILKVAATTESKGFYMPKTFINVVSYLIFLKYGIKNKLLLDYNYESLYHKQPIYINDIAQRILKER